ncbi:MAG: hypothetical protein L0Z49_14385 [Actinobacteria bacterium]|nr:hypothetical protein [Actinomycetota bacterium]
MLRLRPTRAPDRQVTGSRLPWAMIALVVAGSIAQASEDPSRALVTVRTLVIDSLGTRTVDTHTARVPFGHTALLSSRVPYTGPPLSFRLEVGVSAPQPSGIPIRIVSRAWPGEPDDPGAAGAPGREEETILPRESSYLLELHYDPAADRRILLSVKARPVVENEAVPAPPPAHVADRVRFFLEITRRQGDLSEPVDFHQLESIVGRPVRYESGVRLATGLDGEGGEFLGTRVTLTPESSHGTLVTVKLELSGADAIDPLGIRVEPFRHTEVRTVTSGSRFDVDVTVPQDHPPGADDPAILPVTYTVAVTTTLG